MITNRPRGPRHTSGTALSEPPPAGGTPPSAAPAKAIELSGAEPAPAREITIEWTPDARPPEAADVERSPRRRLPAPVLRFGLPAAVVTVSLVIGLAIAGAFSGSTASRPRTQSGTHTAGARATSPAGAVARAPVARVRRASPGRTRAHPAGASRRNRSAPARGASPPPTRPAPATTTPPAAVSPPTTHVVPTPPSGGRPETPARVTPSPRRISTTRPTQRSSAPGRQPTSG